ncbi:hypothetical protein JCGZ_10384 [Jatropha curcas]|uniref:Uncharacterized protein n=1 Tax=Jatropha curcas TaxID=180498 RepID=A0A067KSZ4_JATCU|nr:hypothetical protein JCGZ_10384 [Jatropha curcas]
MPFLAISSHKSSAIDLLSFLASVSWLQFGVMSPRSNKPKEGRLAKGLGAISDQTRQTQLKLVIYLRSLHDFEHFGVNAAQFWQ